MGRATRPLHPSRIFYTGSRYEHELSCTINVDTKMVLVRAECVITDQTKGPQLDPRNRRPYSHGSKLLGRVKNDSC